MARRSAKRRAAEAAPTGQGNQVISDFARVSKAVASVENAKLPRPRPPPVGIGLAALPARKKRKAGTIDDADDELSSPPPRPIVPKRQRTAAPLTPPIEAAPPTPPTPLASLLPHNNTEPELKRPTRPATDASAAASSAAAAAAAAAAPASRRPRPDTLISRAKQQGREALSKKLRSHQRTREAASKASAKRGADVDSSLPPTILDLVGLHAAFLKTITVHIAHSRATAPLDVADFLPDVSRAWGKRQATIEDLRRCIAIQGRGADPAAAAPFVIADYGRGRICVEPGPELQGRVDEAAFRTQFRRNLLALCRERATDHMVDVDVAMEGLALADIPQAPITCMVGPPGSNPLLARGHRALTELRSGIVAKQAASPQSSGSSGSSNSSIRISSSISSSISSTGTPEPTSKSTAAKLSLLDRLRLKQLARAEGPLPPSGPETERRAALQRVDDVAAVISMLSLQTARGLARQSYGMSKLVERLRDSLRLPISTEEAARCVRLLAEQVAPRWIRVVTIGGRETVVVQRDGQPVDRVIRERVQQLLG